MIKHIVMWRIKDNYDGLSKLEICNKIKNELEALKSLIPEIKKIEVGINYLKDSAAYDLALYSEFNSTEDLDSYQKHPDHQKVGKYIGMVKEDRIVVDYKG